MAIFTTSGNSKCAVDGHEYPPKPAGDSHRHTDEDTSALWDRLRADLNNLGAAYGPITEGVGEAVMTQAVVTGTGAWTVGFDEDEMKARIIDDLLADYGGAASSGGIEADRNAYFDGIILAARKKREKQNHYEGSKWGESDVKLFRQMAADERNAVTLSAAMSRPLDWEPRVGWKSGGEGWE